MIKEISESRADQKLCRKKVGVALMIKLYLKKTHTEQIKLPKRRFLWVGDRFEIDHKRQEGKGQ